MITYENGEIATFKLVNGDEIVARVEFSDSTVYVITNPLTAIPSREGGVMFVPSLMTVAPDLEIGIPHSHIMMSHASAEPVADHYREMTTGVKTVRKPGIILG